MSKVITKRDQDYSKWYNDIVVEADLADHSAVRGCMVIKPHGYAIWEKMQQALDKMFKDTGHVNAYFPLFIPKSLFEAEEKNAEGFAKECAIVTHYRLKTDPANKGKLIVDPDAKLEEELVVRPTSEAIIWSTYKKWIQSYRDLPILINQWANVVRWEMRTRLFLRTTEFLWQEGHTAHSTSDEAVKETIQMLGVYADFAENFMALPVVKGRKSEGERFPGEVDTYCIEAMMQDGKALQAGTSHFLGQNFAKASGIQFQDDKGALAHAWTTSWGMSTRMLGAMIMTHSDDDGLICPPRMAPQQVVIIPVIQKPEVKDQVLAWCSALAKEHSAQTYAGAPIRVHVDSRDVQGAKKVWEWVKKGTPIRLEVGPKDIEKNSVFMGRRDKKPRDKQSVARDAFVAEVAATLQEIQDTLFQRAVAFRAEHTREIDSKEEFYAWFT